MSVLVSVILPSFKRGALLDLGLYSLTKQRTSFDFEIVVLNDGVEDDTESVCKKYSNVRYFFTGQRNAEDKSVWRVPGFAINIGVKQVKGDVIVLSCPEIWHLTENSLEFAVTALEPKTLVFPRTIFFDDENMILPYLLNQSSPLLEVPKQLLEASSSILKKNSNAYTMPFFMTLHKQSFMDIGGYDERFTGVCCDDNDLVDRLRLSHKRLFLPSFSILHLYHTPVTGIINEFNEFSKEYTYNYVLWQNGRGGTPIRNAGREWGVL